MTSIPILPNSGAALASLVDGFSRRFGKLWPLAWIACGLAGYLGVLAFCWLYLCPLRVDGFDLTVAGVTFWICLRLGPSYLPAGPVMIAVFVLFDFLSW